MSVIPANKDNFQSLVTLSSNPVLIDFWADWCIPCKKLFPVMERVLAEATGAIKFVSINVDEESELADQFNVISIPMLVLMKDQEVVSTLLGVQSKESVLNMINSHI